MKIGLIEETGGDDSILNKLELIQQELKNPENKGYNPFHKSMYTMLPDLLNITKELFNKHGIVLIQDTGSNTEGYPFVQTWLMHRESKTFFCTDKLILRPQKFNPQGIGSAITYGRRYQLMALLGISGENEDDDGHAASNQEKNNQENSKSRGPSSIIDDTNEFYQDEQTSKESPTQPTQPTSTISEPEPKPEPETTQKSGPKGIIESESNDLPPKPSVINDNPESKPADPPTIEALAFENMALRKVVNDLDATKTPISKKNVMERANDMIGDVLTPEDKQGIVQLLRAI